MAFVEKTVVKPIVAMSEEELEKVTAFLKQTDTYNQDKELSWNIKAFLFSESGLPLPLTSSEKKKMRHWDNKKKEVNDLAK